MRPDRHSEKRAICSGPALLVAVLALSFAMSIGLAFAASCSHAATLAPRWAFEKNAADEGVGNGERLYAVEMLCQLGPSTRLKTEVGGWISKQSDRESSLYASVAWGYRARMISGFSFEAFVGPAYVAKTDSRLGSHLQIKHDIGIGWTDADGWGGAVGLTHFSNAGLFAGPNLGRDFFGVRFLIPL